MIELKEFVYSIVRHWRALILVAFIGIFCMGGFYCVKINGAEKSVESFDESQDWNSAPGVYSTKLQFVTLGNENATSQCIRDIYLSKLLGNSFVNWARQELFGDMSATYIRNVIDIGNGNMDNYFGIEILHYDEDECLNIKNKVIEYVENLNDEMEMELGKHKVMLVDDSLIAGEGDLVKTKLEAIKSEYEHLAIENNPDDFSLKMFIVYCVLGFIISEFFAVLYIMIKDNVKNSIYNVSNVKEEKLELVGDFSALKMRKGLDKLLYRIFIGKTNFSEDGISRLAGFKLEKKYGENSSYIILGDAKEDVLMKIKTNLEKNSENKLKLEYKENLDNDAENLEDWNVDKKIIYTAKRFNTNAKDVKKDIQLYKNLGFEVAGILFI